jgi:hypothetical protein
MKLNLTYKLNIIHKRTLSVSAIQNAYFKEAAMKTVLPRAIHNCYLDS